MKFSMFSAHAPPIAIDFGSSSIKMIQIDPGPPATLVAAVGLRVPDEVRGDKDRLNAFMATQVPRMVRKGKFRGKRAVCSVPAAETFVQHMQIAAIVGPDRDELVKVQLQSQTGWPPYGMVIRTYEVAPIQREGENLVEIICVAISRDTVMRYVELLRRCRLEVVGVHSEVIAMVNAFGFGTTPPGENVTTLYVDLGAVSTKVAIAHGNKVAFARHIPLGGQHLDQKLAESLGCDIATARAQRLSEQALTATGPGKATAGAATAVSGGNGEDAGLGEVIDSIADELSMGIRYHQSLFRGRKIDKVVFVGGESRNIGLCQGIARVLRLPAQLGDPLSTISTKRSARTHGLTLGRPQPGWAVACGLANSPTDL